MTLAFLPFGAWRLGAVDSGAGEDDVATCRVCGCTDEVACASGCWWVPDPLELGDLCSNCAFELSLNGGEA